MDIGHIAETAIVGVATVGAAWGAMKSEMSHLKEWMTRHDEKDDKQFAHVNNRIDTIILQKE